MCMYYNYVGMYSTSVIDSTTTTGTQKSSYYTQTHNCVLSCTLVYVLGAMQNLSSQLDDFLEVGVSIKVVQVSVQYLVAECIVILTRGKR